MDLSGIGKSSIKKVWPNKDASQTNYRKTNPFYVCTDSHNKFSNFNFFNRSFGFPFILHRLLLKAGCAPCLAECRWYGIYTKWVQNLLFEVILVRSQTYFGQKPEEHCFLIEMRCLEVKYYDFLEKWVN